MCLSLLDGSLFSIVSLLLFDNCFYCNLNPFCCGWLKVFVKQFLIFSNLVISFFALSNHDLQLSVHLWRQSSVLVHKPSCVQKKKTYRKLKTIDVNSQASDVINNLAVIRSWIPCPTERKTVVILPDARWNCSNKSIIPFE